MKKVGIVTWFGGSNYGTSLQAYALCYKLEQYGVKPYLLQKCLSWRNVAGIFVRYIKGVNRPNSQEGFSAIKRRKIRDFKRKEFNQFPVCFGYIGRMIYTLQINNLDCIISGSDQLWNPFYTEPFLLLKNLKVKKKYSYASSIGVSEIPEVVRPMYRDALSDFEAISVRETTAIEPLKQLTNKPIIKVVDPTFLLKTEDWIQFASHSTLQQSITNQPYVLCYFIAENDFYWECVADLRKNTGINRVIVLPMKPSHFKYQYEILETAGIHDFVRLIADSSLVCTDSFHATAISINLRKEFITLLRFKYLEYASQNSRIYDLLQRYKLEDRLLKGPLTSPLKKIDYSEPMRVLDNDREKSISYIENILKKI
ncbi:MULTISPECIES: polysaccharide pyruvyl transferase family protein [unclassified Barnesiella]|uniref:polysaccharide pyruvyl transferase family protein n=1 Tax=unclassified Barnesiella TaxID=2645177 RepID=UPI000B38AF70|nr:MULTISPECIES: polysaccharide pyruvyl transferase family protein [unclassified Barnesiella]MCR8912776.1 polysaccharide pyruvyl transferase family protein [Barnesiella sp. ET7]OUO96721.1 hypothetical protein B5F38_12490 [Barnesiella sp. An22]